MIKKLVIALLVLSGTCFAQSVAIGSGGRVGFSPVTTTGQLGSYISYTNGSTAPSTYTLDWSYAGTVPSVCTFQAEGSSDAIHWYALTSAIDCTTANMVHVVNKPVIFFRINVLSYTQGSGTTAVSFNYTRGQ